MPPERDPSRTQHRPLTADDLPPDVLHVGGPTRPDRLQGNPAAFEHEPTICSMNDVNGNPVEVVKMITTSIKGATKTRVDPEVRKEVIRAESLWSEDLPEHHILTHALRLFQTYGNSEKGEAGLPPRKILPNNISPRKILTESGLQESSINGVLRSLKANKLVCDYARRGRSKLWVIDAEIRAIGADGTKYRAQDLKPGLRLPDARGEQRSIGVSQKTSEQVNTAEQAENDPFYIGIRPKLDRQTDRPQVLLKALKAVVHLAGDVQPDEKGWITFTSPTSLIGRLSALTSTNPRQASSLKNDLQALRLIKEPVVVGHAGKTSIYEWSVNAGVEEVTEAQVEQVRRHHYKLKLARDAARTGLAQVAEVIPSVPVEEVEEQVEAESVEAAQPTEAESADWPVPPTHEESAEPTDLATTLSLIEQNIRDMRAELDAKNAEIEALNAENQQMAGKYDQATQTIHEQAAEIAGLQAQLAAEQAKTTIDPAVLENLENIKKLLGTSDS